MEISFETAVRREVREEAGVDVEVKGILRVERIMCDGFARMRWMMLRGVMSLVEIDDAR